MYGLFEVEVDGRAVRFTIAEGQKARLLKGGSIDLDNGHVKVRLELTKLWTMDKSWKEVK